MNTITMFVAKQLCRHVRHGNWLGANWPTYIAGADHRDCDIAAAMAAAEVMNPRLWQESQANFAAEREAMVPYLDPSEMLSPVDRAERRLILDMKQV